MARSARKRMLIGVPVVTALIVSVAIAVVLTSTSERAVGESAAPPFYDQASEAELGAFSILDSEISYADLPTGMQLSGSSSIPEDETATLRGGSVELSGDLVVTVASDGKALCLHGADEGFESTSCSTIAEALEGNVVSVTVCGPKQPEGIVRVVGLAPDGNQAVTVSGGDQGGEVTVSSNVYEALLKSEPAVISGALASGGEFRVSLPLDRMGLQPGERCAQ